MVTKHELFAISAIDSHKSRGATRPLVSVIVPARNEEAGIGACLMSLRQQEGVSCELIVVDDGSTDRTRAIAEFIVGVRVLPAGPLPPGWHGKTNACQTGADAACGEWLLFTDADTVHEHGSLARAIAEARAAGAALLSYSPRQEVHGIVERALMPVIFADLASTYRPKDVSDPASPVAAANGQYLLIRREAYEAIGGHAVCAGDLLEDVALACAAKQAGQKLLFRFGGDAVKTRMYRSWPQMREGWTKNLALLFPAPEGLAARRWLEFGASVGLLAAAATAAVCGKRKLASAATILALPATVNVYRRVRKAHFDQLSTLLAPLGLPLFAYLLRRSQKRHAQGSVAWKGRLYSPGTVKAPAGAVALSTPAGSSADQLRRANADI